MEQKELKDFMSGLFAFAEGMDMGDREIEFTLPARSLPVHPLSRCSTLHLKPSMVSFADNRIQIVLDGE